MTRSFFIQWAREMAALLQSPIAYVLFTGMAFVSGLNFWISSHQVQSGVREVTTIQIFFVTPFYWFVMLVLIPILTMRLLSEEYKSGTIEMLLTAPIQEWDIILAKFLGAITFYMIMWTPPLLSLACFQVLSNNQIPVGYIPLGLSYMMVLLIGMFWISMGLFASSLTKNQIIAGFTAFAAKFMIFVFPMIASWFAGSYMEAVMYFNSYMHMYSFTMGSFDSRPVVFYLSSTAVFLFLTRQVLAVRKLKS